LKIHSYSKFNCGEEPERKVPPQGKSLPISGYDQFELRLELNRKHTAEQLIPSRNYESGRYKRDALGLCDVFSGNSL
jgi:hypothetical protein